MSNKILIVDDDPVVRILVSEFLAAEGYEVETVDSGGACLEKLKGHLPDVLVLDLLMPEMTGVDVLKSLKEDPKMSGVPIVMLSSETDSESIVMSQNLSADRYVQKPFGMREILGAVKSVTTEQDGKHGE